MEKRILDILTVAVAETIGTAILVFLGCMGCVDLGLGDALKPSHLSICIGFGLTVMLIINIFGMVSGAHLNPAVTLAAFVYKLVDIPVSALYFKQLHIEMYKNNHEY